ncbi:MAG TPA: ribonuclease Z [Blastocatellia bacterium]|nr:ribonuclease Z [Blastocatellia bacterium]
MRVIPLGTSSGKPTLKRNVSALAVSRDTEWFLFDCGEGTQTQVARVGLSPTRLDAVFITHLHGDHLYGLPGMLSTMGLDQRSRDLVIVGPRGLKEYLDTLARLRTMFVSYGLDVRELDAADEVTTVHETADCVVKTRALDHRLFALGYRLEEKPRPGRFDLDAAMRLGVPEGPLFGKLQSGEAVVLDNGKTVTPDQVLGQPRRGKVVAYCLDTRPCAGATDLGNGVDLLIHEATYTEDLRAEAGQWGHSTAADAARTAREASARRLLITHFSSRFPDVTPLLDEAHRIFPDTVAAEDLVSIQV